MLSCIAFISHELIIQTHRLNFVLEPVPHNNITIPTTSCQQVIIRVKGHTVQRARTEERHYLLTFNRRPHLKKYAKTPLWHVNIEWNIQKKSHHEKKWKCVLCKTNFQRGVQRHSGKMLPICSEAICCNCICVPIDHICPTKRYNGELSYCHTKNPTMWMVILQPSSHLQPFSRSQISICPSKEVVARRPSFRNTQLEIPSQLLTSNFTSCSQPPRFWKWWAI